MQWESFKSKTPKIIDLPNRLTEMTLELKKIENENKKIKMKT